MSIDLYRDLSQRGRRRLFIKNFTTSLESRQILEIGSLNAPTFMKEEANIWFADYLSEKELVAHYPHKATGIQHVDYVLSGPDPYKKVFDRKFGLIIANHVTEHVPDVIGWLKNLSSLSDSNGLLFLAIPDKRYTFDIARSETTIGEMIENFRDGITTPRFRSIFDHLYLNKKITSKDIWIGKDISSIMKTPRMSFDRAMALAIEMQGKFCSLHCNIFTYQSFLHIFSILCESRLLDWKIHASMDVQVNGNEFLVCFSRV